MQGLPEDVINRFKRAWTIAAGLQFWSFGIEGNVHRMPHKCKVGGCPDIHEKIRDYGPVLKIDDEKWIEGSNTLNPDAVVRIIIKTLDSKGISRYNYSLRKSLLSRGSLGANYSWIKQAQGDKTDAGVTRREARSAGRTRLPREGGAIDTATDILVDSGQVDKRISTTSPCHSHNHSRSTSSGAARKSTRSHELFYVYDESSVTTGTLTNGGIRPVKREPSSNERFSPSSDAEGKNNVELRAELACIKSKGDVYAREAETCKLPGATLDILKKFAEISEDVAIDKSGLSQTIGDACKRMVDLERWIQNSSCSQKK